MPLTVSIAPGDDQAGDGQPQRVGEAESDDRHAPERRAEGDSAAVAVHARRPAAGQGHAIEPADGAA
jgi:hypothetical protein